VHRSVWPSSDDGEMSCVGNDRLRAIRSIICCRRSAKASDFHEIALVLTDMNYPHCNGDVKAHEEFVRSLVATTFGLSQGLRY
jgi:hypothetical protein